MYFFSFFFLLCSSSKWHVNALHTLLPRCSSKWHVNALHTLLLCCSLSEPRIVALVKNRTSDMTVAIGDGANDVSMIQMDDVVVGISG
ncbi:hypothetical protein Bca4012_076794 [Brassica carinata]|uniref:P-type ATPase C-terminal domain-containing protein n=2 Tax=Brassica TaxID=3705 RepID=A0A3P6DXI1_BRAOL|nr:unnamed protein product [Brassica napus]VDD36493.1 unnamed protein product [Brassica oleracea]